MARGALPGVAGSGGGEPTTSLPSKGVQCALWDDAHGSSTTTFCSEAEETAGPSLQRKLGPVEGKLDVFLLC